MINGICLGDIILDCGDSRKLSGFYEGMLGGEKLELYGMPALKTGAGTVLFAQEPDYVPPVWPEEEGRQQKQMHFDFQVPDLAAAVKQAEALGAVRAKAQFGGEHFVTMLDPAGHPFCLCAK
jgi:predicted enzyme related to lactoylglutathione lyase